MAHDPSVRLDFREVVGAFATGVTVVTSRVGESHAGMTLNSFTSVSLDPLMVLVSFAHGTRTLEMVRRSNRYAVNVLHRRQRDVALAFAKPGAPFPPGYTIVDPAGYVAVMHALAILRCEVVATHVAGDHDLVVGEVVDFEGSGRRAAHLPPGRIRRPGRGRARPQRPRDRHRRLRLVTPVDGDSPNRGLSPLLLIGGACTPANSQSVT